MQLHYKTYSLLILTILFFLFSGCSLFPTEEEALAPPLVEPEEISYKTAEATIGYIEDSIQKTAYFVPVVKKDYFFQNRSGRLKSIHVTQGDFVKAGDVLAELLADGVERDIAYQRILVDSREKDLAYTEDLAGIEIQAAKDNIAYLENKYSEMNRSAGVYTANEIENLQKEIDNQKVLLDKLLLNYSNQLDMKKNEMASAQLQLSQLEEDLRQCVLYAQVDGIITYTRNMNEGDPVDIYQTLVTVADPKILQLEYKGTSASDFRLGMKVGVTVNKESHTGEVVLTASNVPLEEMEMYKDTVRIKMDKMPIDVESGDSAQIKLVKDFSENALIVPKRAVKTYMGKDVIYVLEDGIRVERYIQKGVQSTSDIEIIEGLEAGEQVIIE